jgi:FtsZ-binding cell division protein ZapB
MEKVVEEFRRYKVRMEINIKQRDSELSKPLASPMQSHSNKSNLPTSNLSSHLERALSSGSVLPDDNLQENHSNHGIGNKNTFANSSNNNNNSSLQILSEEIQRLKSQLQEQETKWRHSFEKLAKENETLKTKGAESVVAAQWRVRYENCLRDKEDLGQKLKLYTQLSTEVTGDGRTIEQLYMELHEEYKVSD